MAVHPVTQGEGLPVFIAGAERAECSISVRGGDTAEDLRGKKIYADPVEALLAMMSINRITASHDGRTKDELLRGMYRCGGHVHLTRQRGDRQLMAQAVTSLIEEAARCWREQIGALDADHNRQREGGNGHDGQARA